MSEGEYADEILSGKQIISGVFFEVIINNFDCLFHFFHS